MAQLDRIVSSPAVSIESLRLRRTGAQVYINDKDGGFVTRLPQNLIPRFKVLFLISFYRFLYVWKKSFFFFFFFFF